MTAAFHEYARESDRDIMRYLIERTAQGDRHISREDIKRDVGYSRGMTYSVLQCLLLAGLITHTGDRNDPFYALTETGRKVYTPLGPNWRVIRVMRTPQPGKP